MKNYTFKRFVKLNMYFLVSYSLLTGLLYAVMGRFSGQPAIEVWNEILLNATIFSVLFSSAFLILYRRTGLRFANTKVSHKVLQQRLLDIGYEPVPQKKKGPYEVYKPVPPKAAAMAGKIFLQKTPNFYLLEGPVKFLKKIEKQ